MKTIKFLTIVILSIFLSTTVTSCKGEDGKDGVDGAQGPAGPAGEDGNANVITIRFQNPQWNNTLSSTYDLMVLDVPQITSSDINFSVILHYISFQSQDYILLPVDNHFINGVGSGFSLNEELGYQQTQIRIKKTAGDPLPSPTPSVDFLKIIIIRPSDVIEASGNSSGKSANTKQQILNELKNAGVDVNDYEAVCDYYGISYE